MGESNSFMQPTRRAVLGAGLGAALVTKASQPAQAGVDAVGTAPAYRAVTAQVANLWRSPTAPRRVDAAMVHPRPDVHAWLGALDQLPKLGGRRGLHGRIDTQVRRGEPVIVLQTLRNGWTRVACPWHPRTPKPYGYEGWLAPGQISTSPWRGATRNGVPVVTRPRRTTTFLTAARSMTGVAYLWGGASPIGVDCSGLVLTAARAVGVQLPRDTDDQFSAATKVPLATVRPGDLYFFAHPGKRAHHVGIATRPGWMLNAPSTGTRVRQERIVGARRSTLAGVGRYAGLS